MTTEERLSNLEKAILLAGLGTKEILTFDEACVFMGVTRSHLYKLTSGGKVIHYKPNGKMIYVKREELSAWLLQNRVSTSEEIAMKATTHTMNHRARV